MHFQEEGMSSDYNANEGRTRNSLPSGTLFGTVWIAFITDFIAYHVSRIRGSTTIAR